MAVRQILEYDKEEILRKTSRTVEKFDGKIKTIVEDMKETLEKANGAGLAAPQVGILKRIIVIDTSDGILSLINPEIKKAEGEQSEYEGCLSVPNIYGIVKRPLRVTVCGANGDGHIAEYHLRGLAARAACHEIDHLDGILFLDKAQPETLKNISVKEQAVIEPLGE
jgi:peptide deformylase